jgi:hypothetical protein
MYKAAHQTTSTLRRRAFIGACASCLGIHLIAATKDRWSSQELIDPTVLVPQLTSTDNAPQILCVTFPFLYRQKHLPHARLVGPTNKPEEVARFRSVVDQMPRSVRIVLYCGCCPMDKCPNIRPAYQALKELGFSHIQVLNLPTNLHTDWIVKGYPVEVDQGSHDQK